MTNHPFYRVVRAFQTTYHMWKGQAVHHLVICLSCGHWREIRNKANTIDIVGRLFSCKRCGS